MAMYNEITVEAELTNTEYMITKNYNLLENKPQINSVELMGNKSLEDLGINPDAEENIIDTVKVNGAALTPDANKAVDVTITTGTNNGTVNVNGTDVNVKGLKSAAYTESSDYDVSGAAAIVQGNVDALALVVSGKVDKVSGKGLSQNDYTNADKTKLAGIQAGAQVNTVTSVAGKTGAVTLNKSDVGLANVDNTSDANKPISTATQTALDNKVDKVAGKGLSTEDFTTEEKTKLAGISAEANKVEITPVVTEGTTLATISIDGVDTDIKGSDIEVDSTPSPTSTNPLENKAVYELVQNILPEETAEGNPISITDASGLNAKSCEVTFSPIQSGSGDPSPENVRPISGRDSLNLRKFSLPSGYTAVDYVTLTNKVVIDSFNNFNSDNLVIETIFKANSYTQYASIYTTTYANETSNMIRCIEQGASYSFLLNNNTNAGNPVLVSVPSNRFNKIKSWFGGFSVNDGESQAGGTVRGNTNNAQAINLGHQNISVSFKRFDLRQNKDTGNAVYISLVPCTNENGVAGFYDLVSKRFFTTENSNDISASGTFDKIEHSGDTTHTATFPDTVYGGEYEFVSGKVKSEWGYIASYNGETITEPWISDRDVYVAGTTPSTGAEVCYKLATPQEITLTPETIELLKGNNVLFADGDNITLKYSADIKEWVLAQLQS